MLTFAMSAFAQQKSEKSPFDKFGKITNENLSKTIYDIDSNANAVVLSNVGDSYLEGNSKGWFSLRTSVHKVVHILTEKGYDEASGQIRLVVTKNGTEKISSFKAVTYNLENGKIIQTKIGKNDLIKEQVDENNQLMKFTMPNVKKGSIIEYEYQVLSDYMSIPDPWYFQSTTSPTLWSEYTFGVPEFFTYQITSRGFIPLLTQDPFKKQETFRISESRTAGSSDAVDLKAEVLYRRWVVKNAPELKEEPFTKSVRNHLSRIEFQLATQQYPLEFRNLRNSWQDITSGLLESDQFGRKLNSNNGWMKEEIASTISGETDPLAKAQKVYAFVRDNFKTTTPYGIFMTDDLKNVFKTRKGNGADINLLLTAMLRNINLDAEPVLTSTASHGYAFEFFPMINSLNYTLCKLEIDGKTYFLDATQSRLGFGRLPDYCYNGYGVVVNKSATSVQLSSDNVTESRKVTMFVTPNENGYSIKMKKDEGYYHSFDIRNDISDEGQSKFIEDLKKNYPQNTEISDVKLEGLKDFNNPVEVNYNINFPDDGENIIYMNPYFGENYSKNPFASTDRTYPVEFPYTQDETINASIIIPQGFKLDELPKSVKLKLDEQGKSYFEYLVQNSGSVVNFKSRIVIGKSFFMPEEYNNLREFFNFIVKKQAEQIVFKKTAE